METTSINRIRLARSITVLASVLLLASCSGPISGPSAINRDAASRCIQTIDAWKQELAKLDSEEQQFDSVSEKIRTGYRTATPQERKALRSQLTEVVSERDEAGRSADALFNEIIRELEYVPHDKTARAKLAFATASLKDADGVHTPEVKFAMNAVSAELHVLLKVD
jgi:Skp family chaperone for outer membrane proteins